MYRLIIFDVGGTLRRTIGPNPYPLSRDEWEVMPGIVEAVRSIPNHVALGIATNQPAVFEGLLDLESARAMIEKLVESIFGERLISKAIRVCIDKDSFYYKPKPGMLRWLMILEGTTPQETLFIGNSPADCWTAHNALCDFRWVWDFIERGL